MSLLESEVQITTLLLKVKDKIKLCLQFWEFKVINIINQLLRDRVEAVLQLLT
jgi:hypothetical protein